MFRFELCPMCENIQARVLGRIEEYLVFRFELCPMCENIQARVLGGLRNI